MTLEQKADKFLADHGWTDPETDPEKIRGVCAGSPADIDALLHGPDWLRSRVGRRCLV